MFAKRVKQIVINAFLIFHILAIGCWCVPSASHLAAASREVVRPYFLWAGLFQSWDMFSPTPRSINSYIESIVVYRDGSTRVWAFPRMEELSFTQRYFKERYRKYTESLEDEKNEALWPDAARYVARLTNTGPVPIRMVLLARYWSDIGQPVWHSHVFYAYTIQPEDMK